MLWLGKSLKCFAISGSDNKITVFNSKGQKLNHIVEESCWIWTIKSNKSQDVLLLGTHKGVIDCKDLFFRRQICTYATRYAYTESLGDVMIQNLTESSSNKNLARIKCKDYVKNIAIYLTEVAILLPSKTHVYVAKSMQDVNYKCMAKVNSDFPVDWMLVTSGHLWYAHERELRTVDFKGFVASVWNFECAIKVVSNCGGPPKNESIILGLENGAISQVFLSNEFPVELCKLNSAAQFLQLNADRDKLVAIEQNQLLTIHCLSTGQVLFQEPKNPSQLVGFNKATLFCLSDESSGLEKITVPMTNALYSYLNSSDASEQEVDFEKALAVANLGITDSDWRNFGERAVMKAKFRVAQSAFAHLRDHAMLQMLQELSEQGNQCESLKIQAIMAAYRGQFAEASDIFCRIDCYQDAFEMYTCLRNFAQAQLVMSEGISSGKQGKGIHSESEIQKELLAKHAEWARTTKDHRQAFNMFMNAGKYNDAIFIAMENNWPDLLMEVSKRVDLSNREELANCADCLAEIEQFAMAAECYERLGDVENQANMLIEGENWQDALALAEQNPACRQTIYASYGRYLAERDDFVQAQEIYVKAGMDEECMNVLQILTECALFEDRYAEASFYFWKLGQLYLDRAEKQKDKNKKLLRKLVQLQENCETLANLTYAYGPLYLVLNDPFVTLSTESYFNMARFCTVEFNNIENSELPAPDLDYSQIMMLLSVYAERMGLGELSRQAALTLLQQNIPNEMAQTLEESVMRLQSQRWPKGDSGEMFLHCYRCSASNQVLKVTRNCCNSCQEPFIYSFISFEQLPLVRFELKPGYDMSFEEIVLLVNASSSMKPTSSENHDVSDEMIQEEGIETLKISQLDLLGEDEERDMNSEMDPFGKVLALHAEALTKSEGNHPYQPIRVEPTVIESMSPNEVIILKGDIFHEPKFYKNMLPELNISSCESCSRLFLTEDLEVHCLSAKDNCPFCQTSIHI
ncbi:hypothetical protein Ciccas_001550 [Cichlidogyrus casuarinus]|uniref:Intraflagellar transport protein 122 homolog n=1 Tax=Cichlidogyrus casuarinus TaxID=1844966 RepID=A0ABD2QJV5_9PLAT